MHVLQTIILIGLAQECLHWGSWLWWVFAIVITLQLIGSENKRNV